MLSKRRRRPFEPLAAPNAFCRSSIARLQERGTCAEDVVLDVYTDADTAVSTTGAQHLRNIRINKTCHSVQGLMEQKALVVDIDSISIVARAARVDADTKTVIPRAWGGKSWLPKALKGMARRYRYGGGLAVILEISLYSQPVALATQRSGIVFWADGIIEIKG